MIILKNCCNGKCTQPLICKTDDVCLTELPAFVLSRTAKQTAPCQSAGDEPQKKLKNLVCCVALVYNKKLKFRMLLKVPKNLNMCPDVSGLCLVSSAAVFWDVTQRSQKTAAEETRLCPSSVECSL